MEVETPALASATVTDPSIESLEARDGAGRRWYLQTSPEFAMKTAACGRQRVDLPDRARIPGR